jgi:hypothetical protein
MPQPVKQPINISFEKGLNLKTDPYQLQVGNFLSLVNSVFDKVGRLTKRNGFPQLTVLPNTNTSYLTTFNGDLQAIGQNLLAFSSAQDNWVSKGSTHPIDLNVQPLIRNAVNQSEADLAVAPNGLMCVAYAESDSNTGIVAKYAIADSVTGQNIIEPTILTGADSTLGQPRVFIVGNYFVILYTKHTTVEALAYVAISWVNPEAPVTTGNISPSYGPSSTLAFDAILLNNNLYIAYNAVSSGGIELVAMSPLLVLGASTLIDAAHTGTVFSLASDTPNQLLWVTYWASATGGYTTALTPAMIQVLAPTHIITTGTILNIASIAASNSLTFYYEVANNYSYDASIPTHFIEANTCSRTGTVGVAYTVVRSVGLASKAFVASDGNTYFLAAYQSPYQSTYFLIEGNISTQANPIVVAKLAYSNGGGYLPTGLPNANVSGNVVAIPYLNADLVAAVNKNTNVPAGTQVNGIYSQTGVNAVSFDFTTANLTSSEIGNNLQLSGGFLWNYDGYLPVENNFFLWPDSVEVSGSATTGDLTPQQYFYQVTYEWSDNQGNVYRSAPSIPVTVTLTSDSSVTVNVPTLRLTYKISSPLKICIYRWSEAQQIYYQVTSLSFTVANPLTLNNTTIDSITFTDTLGDSTILGNNILYTNGGVVENISPPATDILSLFDDRQWLVDAEDRNLLWYSKQVIEATPVEMSDLFTFYVAPSTGAQGSTGFITALYPMDDKLIIFKESAIYYINGTGPDNTGANNAYSQPIFITSSVGCTLPRSIVMTPMGLMFQSNKGIWLLGRDLSTQYIGDAVEDFNSSTVTSAIAIPETNQVRFALSTGEMLMYDYYVKQWGEFEGIPSVSSTLYENEHTIVDSYGRVFQESPGTYLDGVNPVLMSFSTSWLNLAALRGYQRAYWFYFLGTYLSPHKLNVSVAYDYNSSAAQSNLITPINASHNYGSYPYFGGDGFSPFGGPTSIEQFRIFLQQQRCKAFQITIQEVFDPSFGTIAGPGLTLSGLNCIVAVKKGWAPIPASQSVG